MTECEYDEHPPHNSIPDHPTQLYPGRVSLYRGGGGEHCPSTEYRWVQFNIYVRAIWVSFFLVFSCRTTLYLPVCVSLNAFLLSLVFIKFRTVYKLPCGQQGAGKGQLYSVVIEWYRVLHYNCFKLLHDNHH